MGMLHHEILLYFSMRFPSALIVLLNPVVSWSIPQSFCCLAVARHGYAGDGLWYGAVDPTRICAKTPYYNSYPRTADWLSSSLFAWSNTTDLEASTASPVIQIMTSPNNPDGTLRNKTVPGDAPQPPPSPTECSADSFLVAKLQQNLLCQLRSEHADRHFECGFCG